MEIELNSVELCLKENTPLCLRSGKGLQIACTDGMLWITITGKVDDIFLNAGERYQLKSNALAIVESIGSGKFRLENSKISRFSLLTAGIAY